MTANIHLLISPACDAFIKAAEQLKLDPVELANSIDLAEVILYAADYANLHSPECKGIIGRDDQVQAARSIIMRIAPKLVCASPAQPAHKS